MDAQSKIAIERYYASAVEKDRLESDYFILEGIRTKEIISRYLSGKMNIADIGGGAGYYSIWLASLGHNVQFVDLSMENVSLMTKAVEATGVKVAGIHQGNATKLAFIDNEFDLVLMLGPLYHLTDRTDRLRALGEARRILKPGGLMICAVISRYASLMDGYQRDLVTDPEFCRILAHDLATGIHLNHTINPEYFTTAYFHTPQEIKAEVGESGFTVEKLLAAESFGFIVQDLKKKMTNATYRENLLETLRAIESNEDLVAMSPHILCVARK